MDLFKGALYLVDGGPQPELSSHGFEPAFGNAVATRQWLQDAFAANDPAEPVEAAVESPTQSAA